MERTFAYTEHFNNGESGGHSAGEGSAPLLWDTSKVTSMIYMFGLYNCLVNEARLACYNQNMDTTQYTLTVNGKDEDFKPWNTENVIDMAFMFLRQSSFNNGQPRGAVGDAPILWNISKLQGPTNPNYSSAVHDVFRGNFSFNQSISGLDFSLTLATVLFYGAENIQKEHYHEIPITARSGTSGRCTIND